MRPLLLFRHWGGGKSYTGGWDTHTPPSFFPYTYFHFFICNPNRDEEENSSKENPEGWRGCSSASSLCAFAVYFLFTGCFLSLVATEPGWPNSKAQCKGIHLSYQLWVMQLLLIHLALWLSDKERLGEEVRGIFNYSCFRKNSKNILGWMGDGEKESSLANKE